MYPYNECDDKFKTKFNLKRHIESIHLKIEKTMTKIIPIGVNLRRKIASGGDFEINVHGNVVFLYWIKSDLDLVLFSSILMVIPH